MISFWHLPKYIMAHNLWVILDPPKIAGPMFAGTSRVLGPGRTKMDPMCGSRREQLCIRVYSVSGN